MEDERYDEQTESGLPSLEGEEALTFTQLGEAENPKEMEARRLAGKYQVPYVNLEAFHVNTELLEEIPVDLMFRYSFIPYQRKDDMLQIVVGDPSNLQAIDELEVLLGKPIEVSVGNPERIQEILKRSESSRRVLEEASQDFRLQVVQDEEDISSDEDLSIEKLTSDTSPIIRLVDSTVFNALQRRASDIHIETREQDVVVKYRIDGVLYQAMEPIDKRFHSTIISRIKVMSELDIAEKRIPQDGRFKVKIAEKTIDFRVSIMPSAHGENAVIRILDKESTNEEFAHLNLEVLGFSGTILHEIRRYIRAPYGMFLVTGPTGSGKTTTLYAAISEINSSEDKIITIEDPIEYLLEGVTQIPVNKKKGLTFATGLRSILRHDPDKIMVGEIRDAETAQIAVQSALTGHLVFTTVHANNVIDVLGRFLNMGVDPYNFVSSLNCILAQRLVRLICSKCKKPAEYRPEQLQESGFDPEKYKDHTFYRGAGCSECNGVGYRGRTVICELLNLSDTVQEMIIDKRPATEIKRQAIEEGITFLRQGAVEKALAGLTTIEEINKATFVE